jgi:acyl-CoA synthetase (NDP forming)
VGSVSAFAETLKVLHHGGPLTGNRLVSMSCSGGEAALVADMAAGRSIQFPPFDSATRDRVAPEEAVELVAQVRDSSYLPVNDARVTAVKRFSRS